MNNMTLNTGPRAEQKDLVLWSGSAAMFGRYDYVSAQYRLSDMLTNHFFGNCWSMLRKGDWITLIDCEDQIMVVRVDEISKAERKIVLSKVERLFVAPVAELKQELPEDPGFVYRYRSSKAGGHSIVAADGSVFAINFETRTEAERVIANIYESAIFEVPAGHEPAEPFVSSNTKIWKK